MHRFIAEVKSGREFYEFLLIAKRARAQRSGARGRDRKNFDLRSSLQSRKWHDAFRLSIQSQFGSGGLITI